MNDLQDFGRKVGYRSLVVDVGAGSSPYKAFFKSTDYITLDIVKTRTLSVVADIHLVPIRDEVADLVVAIEVLEHIPETDKVFDELRRILKKGGDLIMSVPFLYGIHDEIDHIRLTEKAIKYLANKHGFRILDLRSTGGIFSVLGQLLNQIPYEISLRYMRKRSSSRLQTYLALPPIFLGYLALIPITKLLLSMDKLDRAREWTLGYCLLLHKE